MPGQVTCAGGMMGGWGGVSIPPQRRRWPLGHHAVCPGTSATLGVPGAVVFPYAVRYKWRRPVCSLMHCMNVVYETGAAIARTCVRARWLPVAD
jgi:hypothetical protein